MTLRIGTFVLAFAMMTVAACGGESGGPGDGSTPDMPPVEKPEDSPPVEPVDCEPGARYTCACDNGNTGNKFCAWTGDAFSECMLCGSGAAYLEDTGLPCNTNPSSAETYVPCPVDPQKCTSLVCFDHVCVVATSLPSAVIPDTAADDCRQTMCDGNGNAVSVPNPDDCAGACDAAGVCVIP
jgi:hypothetical protein